MPEEKSIHPAATPAEEALWLFLHIPKTAGSSFRSTLARHLQPECNINIEGRRGKKRRHLAFAEAIDEFLALDRDKHFVFASGHINMAEAVRIRTNLGRPVKLLTMLREPVQRVISDYRYQLTPAHPTHGIFSAAFPTLESFVESPRSQNKMFRFLALPGETVDTAITRLERDFRLIGLVEMYALTMRLCSELIGGNLAPDTSLNVTQATSGNDVAVSERLRDRTRQLNDKDERLWLHFRDRLGRFAEGQKNRGA
jgi:hypothetical protein